MSESIKVGTSVKAKPTPKTKVKASRSVANSRFNYFVQCKHDLKNASTCPMCKLVNIVTRQHFIDEKTKVDEAHEQSLLNRAQLRLTLMLRWARCQSTLYNKFAPTPTFDIVLSKSLALLLVDEDAVCSRQSPIDFDEVIKVLNRRNRIQEVGHYAAIYLQTRIRKYLAQRYVRRIMLERFEYVPATRRKDAFYVDNYWMRKWNRIPKYLQNENPATPRTLNRRIAADERIRTLRFENYMKAVAKQYRSIEDVWAQEESTVQFLKQLGILRDLVRIAMLTLTKSRLQKAAAAAALERAVERDKQAVEDARRGASTGPRSRGGASPALASNRSALSVQATEDAIRNEVAPELNKATVDIPLQPVWITLSAPAAPARQLGLALVLATVPSPATGAIAIHTDNEDGPPRVSAAAGSTTTGGLKQHGPSKAPVFGLPPTTPKITKIGTASSLGGSAASGLSAATPRLPSHTQNKASGRPPGSPGMITGIAQLHRSLQFLENSIWLSLKCNSPEEVLSKLVLEDLRPTLESVLNISQEPQQIWQGDIAHMSRDNATSSGLQGGFGESRSDIPSLSNALVNVTVDDDEDNPVHENEQEEEEREKFQHEVLPLTLQLRPFFAERGCNGFFRLFFYMDELVAVTASSPWAFYPEVLKNRDVINTSLRTYAALNATRAFVQHYLTKANIHTIGGDNSSHTDSTLSLPLMGATASSSVKAGGAGGSRANSRRSSVVLQSPSTSAPSPGRRRSVLGGNASAAVTMAQSLPIQQTDLSCLYTPPESLIFENTAPDRAALMRMRDIAQFSDEKTIYMAHKYSFLKKNLSFAERLKRAELNLANRKKRRGATTTAPTKAFMDASQYHQRLAKFQKWRKNDPYLPSGLIQRQEDEEELSPQLEEVNRQYMKDIFYLRDDLIGPKLLTLLQGAEAMYEADRESINVFAENYTSTTETTNTVSEIKALDNIETQSEDENNCDEEEVEEEKLSEYEAKLHRYSRKVRMEIMDRLRQPPNIQKAQELFPLVVMDVYVQLPGKVGLSNLGGTSSHLAGTGGLQRNSTASSISSVGSNSSSTALPSSNTGLLAVELQQVVGAFSCETDRCPPNLDCGLLEWDHFYNLHQQRVTAATAPSPSSTEPTLSRLGSHNKKPSLMSVNTGSSTGSNMRSASSSTSWTPANSETGVSTFLSPLASGSQYQFHLLGSAPSKQYLERILPKKVKEWLGLPV